MAESNNSRSVTVTRAAAGRFQARNVRGGTLDISGEGSNFTPVELLLVAIGACSGLDVDALTTRRTEPESFSIEVTAEKVRDGDGNHLDDIQMTFRVTFPSGEAGDHARERLPDAVAKSHDRLCTVSRTVELRSPIHVVIA